MGRFSIDTYEVPHETIAAYENWVGQVEIDPRGFQVHWIPGEHDCDCGVIRLVQAISQTGFFQSFSHMDTNLHHIGWYAANHDFMPFPINPGPAGSSYYSYIDSPSHQFVTRYQISVAAQCWRTNLLGHVDAEILAVVYFEFDNRTRTITSGPTVGQTDHWDEAVWRWDEDIEDLQHPLPPFLQPTGW